MAIAEDFNLNSIIISLGNLEVRLAENNVEIDAAQALRYKVFFEEMKAKPTVNQKKTKRDYDAYDFYFDHILVIDHAKSGTISDKVIGTYRLNRGDYKGKKNFYYTSSEYDLSNLISYKGKLLELGRSCVDKNYRNGKTMQLLWTFIAQYVNKYDIKIMFGCASFPGVNAEVHKTALSYLYHRYLAPSKIRPKALKDRFIDMQDTVNQEKNFKLFLNSIPPLIKGYIRLGAFVGDGAVIDYDFNTTDVCIVLPTKKIATRYMDHYERKY
jgi:putative hemolysin